MIINHNLGAMNALSALNSNSNALNSVLQKLSTGKKINSAADNASGYAISQKMQGQINGLNQATQNAQDGISMIQTASGALNETTSLLQNMRQLAVQASNSTTTVADRQDLQTQFNQLASQINNIGNTTQFNTQNLLQGGSGTNLTATGLVTAGTLGAGTAGVAATMTQATQATTITTAAASGDTFKVTLNGQTLTVNMAANSTAYASDSVYGVTTSANADSASVNLPTSGETAAQSGTNVANALTAMINQDSILKGGYTATANSSGVITISAVKGGQFDGTAAQISGVGVTGTMAATVGGVTAGTSTNATQATNNISFAGIASSANVSSLVGNGLTINGQQIQFYNANNGPYTGSAIGVNVSNAIADTANWAKDVVGAIVQQAGPQMQGVTLSGTGTTSLTVTANQAGTAGNSLAFSDGGMNQNFQSEFQIGANTGQTMSVSISDMRAQALGVSGTAGATGFSATNNVNNGTNNTNIQASLDITSTTNADKAISVIDNAVQTVTTEQANLGAVQNRLQSTINNLGTSSQNLTTAQSGITDVNMAQAMSKFTQDNVLQQAAVSMLAQANQQPQLVLKLLG